MNNFEIVIIPCPDCGIPFGDLLRTSSIFKGELSGKGECPTCLISQIGTRVRSLVDFSDVPKGTEGIVDEQYSGGFMVAWDLPDSPLPKGYAVYDGRPAIVSRILRDGFSFEDAKYLERV